MSGKSGEARLPQGSSPNPATETCAQQAHVAQPRFQQEGRTTSVRRAGPAAGSLSGERARERISVSERESGQRQSTPL